MMKKLFIFLTFVAVVTNTNAQSEIKVSGPMPKVGSVIHGVVKDSIGPMESVHIIEFDTINQKIVAEAITDKNGHFSITHVDNAHVILGFKLRYDDVSSIITGSKFEFFLRKVPDLREKIKDYPFLVLDGRPRYGGDWDGFDITKETYSKKEISKLFGVKVADIDSIKVLKGVEATTKWGRQQRAKNGVIEVQRKDKEEGNGKHSN
ncbi:MAG TPA: hypothetical protein VFC94_05295 [Bacteroidaceae bacterium]|nr:hypothetical protein [Bacteroidaceae bacterium]